MLPGVHEPPMLPGVHEPPMLPGVSLRPISVIPVRSVLFPSDQCYSRPVPERFPTGFKPFPVPGLLARVPEVYPRIINIIDRFYTFWRD